MKIKVNKNQLIDDWEDNYERLCYKDGVDLTLSTHTHNFTEEEVSFEQLQEYISQGNGIKINCK